MDIVVVFLKLITSECDDLFACGEDEIAWGILEVSPVAPVHFICAPGVLVQVPRLSAEPMVADAEGEFVGDVSLEKRIK